MRTLLILGLILLAGRMTRADEGLAPEPSKGSAPVDFDRQIRPLLSDRCFACHGPDENTRAADLRFDQPIDLEALGLIDVAMPDDSELLRRVASDDPDQQMPPESSKLPRLTEADIKLLRQWIAEGAEADRHWSFAPLKAVIAPPAIADQSAALQPLDSFVLQDLVGQQRQFTGPARAEQWLRRVTLDLTGLPPTAAEVREFLADSRPQREARVVDRLLASPAYGEHAARLWLDIARYADTFGYQADRLTHVWPWRDWVIDACNSGMPYDLFLKQQLAGDLLPNATDQTRIATAFNRLHRQTNEGGSIEAEFRAEYVADRVQTFGTAALGLTLGCARCHDHKYDPISMPDFYGLSAFFCNIDESGLYSHFTETAPTPALPLFSPAQKIEHQRLEQELTAAEQQWKGILEESLSEQLGQAGETVEPAQIELPAPKVSWTFDQPDLSLGGNERMDGRHGLAVRFNGDDPFTGPDDFPFSRVTPFTIGLWVFVQEHAPRMIVLHRSRAAEDAAFRGIQLVLDDGLPDFGLIHFWPGNALRVRGREPLPLNRWVHLSVTYDGSSRADGVRLAVDGLVMDDVEVIRDHLTRDITYRTASGDDAGSERLALGARFRDVGFRGNAIDEVRVFDRAFSTAEVALLAEQPPTVEQLRTHHWMQRVESEQTALRQRISSLRQDLNELVMQVPQLMVMEELPSDQVRPAHLLARGAYDAPGEEVSPRVPAALGGLEQPTDHRPDRLDLANWVCDPQHPLTARVAANRLWEQFFGRGLVTTPEDFGAQGARPTHPELLDYLARRLIDSEWNLKSLAREIVLSATYRQDSTPRDPADLLDDPDNQRLARGPVYRLTAEQVRDQALAASGLLVRKIGGPSVRPYQPDGLWTESGASGGDYVPDQGEGLYRRSLYTFWKRTVPPPNMLAFDAVSRETCVARRERTNTPLQALVLLNDPQFLEASRVLAASVLALPDPSRIEELTLRLWGSAPDAEQLRILTRLLEQQRARWRSDMAAAQQFIQVGKAPIDPQFDPVELASTVAVVQAIMNTDACIVRR
jgi:hypothetical protein